MKRGLHEYFLCCYACKKELGEELPQEKVKVALIISPKMEREKAGINAVEKKARFNELAKPCIFFRHTKVNSDWFGLKIKKTMGKTQLACSTHFISNASFVSGENKTRNNNSALLHT